MKFEFVFWNFCASKVEKSFWVNIHWSSPVECLLLWDYLSGQDETMNVLKISKSQKGKAKMSIVMFIDFVMWISFR